MQIKFLFDDLKKLGIKKYFHRNGEEELYFSRSNLTIEIYNINGNIDLVIKHNGSRENYENSPSIPDDCKQQIKQILSSYLATQVKCRKIAQILLELFGK